ncbi:hypothetical protein ACROYT_G000924 [Oculina patagonica]
MSSANVLPSAPAYGDREETQLYPSLPTNAENFRLTEISKIEKEISAEAEHYRLVLKKYKKVRKVIHYSVVCLGAVTAALSSGAVATSLTGVGIVIGVPVAAVAETQVSKAQIRLRLAKKQNDRSRLVKQRKNIQIRMTDLARSLETREAEIQLVEREIQNLEEAFVNASDGDED